MRILHVWASFLLGQIFLNTFIGTHTGRYNGKWHHFSRDLAFRTRHQEKMTNYFLCETCNRHWNHFLVVEIWIAYKDCKLTHHWHCNVLKLCQKYKGLMISRMQFALNTKFPMKQWIIRRREKKLGLFELLVSSRQNNQIRLLWTIINLIGPLLWDELIKEVFKRINI